MPAPIDPEFNGSHFFLFFRLRERVMADPDKTPWDNNAKATPRKPSIRSRLSMVLLVLILVFFGYGIFARNRLVAELTNERAAIESITALQGETMEADSTDWRAIFSPDKPEQGVRVGYVTLPEAGPAPGYQKKVTEILEKLPCCHQLYIVQTSSKQEPKKEEESQDKAKVEKPEEGSEKIQEPAKSEEKAPEPVLESINIDELRKQFPNLVIYVVPAVPKGEARGAMGT
jgi:hypothetical protein